MSGSVATIPDSGPLHGVPTNGPMTVAPPGGVLTPAAGRTGAMPGYNPGNPVPVAGVAGYDPSNPTMDANLIAARAQGGTSVQQGSVDLTNSVQNYLNALPSAGPAVAQTSAGAQLKAAGDIAVARAQAEAAIKLQTDNAAAAARFGFTPGAPSGINAKLSEDILALENTMDAKRGDILKKQGTSFFDDPVGFLFNQVALPYDIAEFNTLAGTQEHKLAVLHSLGAATDEQMKRNAAVDTASGTALLAGESQRALGQAQLTEADASFKAVQQGMQATSIRMTGSEQQFNAAVAANSALVAAQKLVIEQNNSDIMKQQYDLSVINSNRQADADKRLAEIQSVEMVQRNLNLGNDQEKVVALHDLNTRLLKAATVYGIDPVSWQQLQIMGDGPLKRMLDQAITDPNVQQNGHLGFDATTSLNTANTLNLALTPGMNIVREKMIGWENAAIAKSGGVYTWKQMDPGAQHLAQQTSIQDETRKEARNIQDTGGIYSPNSLFKTLQIGQGEASLANTQIGAILAPLANTDQRYPTKASDVLTTAANLISSGKSTPAQMAAEVSRIYTAIMVDNNDVRQYNRLVMPSLDPLTDGYHTYVANPFSYGSSTPLNLTSRSAVEGYLTRLSIANKMLTQVPTASQ